MATHTKPNSTNQEHPLANILINVLIPVFALSFLSKDPALQESLGKEAKLWHIGPIYAMVAALALPLGYGVWHFIKSRKANLFSALGLVSVLLTGGLTIYLWNKNGTVKPNAGLLFGIKEGLIPLILGVAVLLSHRWSTPLIQVFLYNDTLFDIKKIESRVEDLSAESKYDSILLNATRLFAASFFVSAVMNLGLAQWFFRDFNPQMNGALEEYNAIVGKVMGWGFAVIGIPILIFLFLTLRQLIQQLKALTGFDDKDLLMPR